MKFLFAPPAPGGVGANKQVIFNDGGVLAGDAGLTYDKATDILTLTSPAGASAGLRLLQTATADWEIKNVGTSGNLALSQSGSNHVIVTGSGNVGIGITPSAWISAVKGLQVGAYGAIGGSSSNFNVYGNLYSSAGGTAYLGNGYGTLFQMTNGQYVFYQAANNTSGAGALVTPSLIQAMTLDVSGNLNLGVGNLVPTNGKGIDFSATPNSGGTMTSELLNDYEEGTWTATLKGSVSDPTTPVTATGRYTKIGRVVTVQVAIENFDTTGASGEISITGLPFTNGGPRTLGTAGSISGATFTEMMVSELTSGSATITFQSIISNAAWTPATHNVGSFRYFWANVTYTV